jgi:hypothetical protein
MGPKQDERKCWTLEDPLGKGRFQRYVYLENFTVQFCSITGLAP